MVLSGAITSRASPMPASLKIKPYLPYKFVKYLTASDSSNSIDLASVPDKAISNSGDFNKSCLSLSVLNLISSFACISFCFCCSIKGFCASISSISILFLIKSTLGRDKSVTSEDVLKSSLNLLISSTSLLSLKLCCTNPPSSNGNSVISSFFFTSSFTGLNPINPLYSSNDFLYPVCTNKL